MSGSQTSPAWLLLRSTTQGHDPSLWRENFTDTNLSLPGLRVCVLVSLGYPPKPSLPLAAKFLWEKFLVFKPKISRADESFFWELRKCYHLCFCQNICICFPWNPEKRSLCCIHLQTIERKLQKKQTQERKDTLCCEQSFLKLLDHMTLSNAGTAKLCSPKSQDIRTLGFRAM